MVMSVARYAPSIIAGSALAGFGLSFGRDVYRKTKKYWPILIVLMCMVGVFFSGLWLFRNYQSFLGSIFKKLGALLVLTGSTIGLNVALIVIGGGIDVFYPEFSTVIGEDQLNSDVLNSIDPRLSYIAGTPVMWVLMAQCILFLAGAIMGIGHRKRRRWAWRAEKYNAQFLEEHGLEVVDDGEDSLRLRDQQEGIGYRLNEKLQAARELEFMALGKRNKRGYIQYDHTGRYTEWSGLVDVR